MKKQFAVTLRLPCESKEQAQGLKIQLDRALEDAFQDGEISEEVEVQIEEY